MSATLIGPFRQLLTMTDLPAKGPLPDDALTILEDGALLVENGTILEAGPYPHYYEKAQAEAYHHQALSGDWVALPGFIDSHTHMCWGGRRSRDYAARIAGASYTEILEAGGGIYETMRHTRDADYQILLEDLHQRAMRHLREGVTTIEVKSGYGLSANAERKQLRVIQEAARTFPGQIMSTCLAAHVLPPEFDDASLYLDYIIQELIPSIQSEQLTRRMDIFVEPAAFSEDMARIFLKRVRSAGMDITVHADQFTSGGSALAVDVRARSADHLEASSPEDIRRLAASDTVATVLPGASLGLGMAMAPARALLDAGACVSIASDWNPGSAPMGDLLIQAALLGAQEKLTTAETLAAITTRAAQALGRSDLGRLEAESRADFIAFPTDDYRDILYHQGKMKPGLVWTGGHLIPEDAPV